MEEALPAAASLMQMATGAWLSKIVYVAAKLGIADLIAEAPRSAADLAAQVDVDPRSLYRVLRALGGLGLLEERPDGTFALTPRGTPLRADAPDTVRSFVIMMNEEQYEAWGALLESVRTGRPAFDHVFGQPVFSYFRDKPISAAIFQRAMDEIHREEGPAVARAYDFEGARRVLDVGGGKGSLLSAILARYPHLSGILFDTAYGISEAQRGAGGPLPRCELITGDFFAALPRGADILLLKHVVHDWADEQAITLLSNCRAALPEDGKVLVLESLIGPPNRPSFAQLLDLHMMAVPGGQERTEAEYAALLVKAGLRHTRTLRVLPDLDLLEAVPG